jgi:hypothetical protein
MNKLIFCLLFLLLECSASAAPAGTSPAQELAKVKASVMAADYKGDLKELARLRDELAKWPNERELAYLARYWSGFASWRMAMNGSNHDMKPDELSANLKSAATDFYASIRLKDDYADAYAAAAGVNAWLAKAAMPDTVAVRERAFLAYALLSRATTLEPKNPRVLWIRGGFLQFAPGGSIPRAIEVYQQQLEEAQRRGSDASSPFPDWGKPEALMSLSYAHFAQTPADLAKAHDEAASALEVVPEWSYVRDNLLPMIDAKVKESQAK